MAYTDRVIALARETKLFVGLESTPGTQVIPTDSGMNSVLVFQAGQVSQAIRVMDDPQYRNTRSRLLPLSTTYDPGKFSFNTLLKAVGGAGAPAEPEIDPLLQSLFGRASATNNTWFGTTPHRAYTLLPVSPAGALAPSFTVWFKEGHTVYYFCGGTVNQAEFNIVGNDMSKAGFSGEFMRMGWCGTDRVGGAGTGTSLVVVDAKKFFLADSSDHVYIQFMDPSTGALTPSGGVAVNAVDVSTNTLTLATSQTWGATDVVVPYLPAVTEVGLPLFGKFGIVTLGAYADKVFADLPSGQLIVNGVKVTITSGIKYYADLKDGKMYPTEYASPSFREVRGELTIFAYRNLPDWNYKAMQSPLVPDYLLVPTQDKAGSAGRIIQLHMPHITYETPNKSGEDEKTATIPFRCTATTDYDDEFAMVYIGG